jgi:hypothetical protein
VDELQFREFSLAVVWQDKWEVTVELYIVHTIRSSLSYYSWWQLVICAVYIRGNEMLNARHSDSYDMLGNFGQSRRAQ